MKANPGLNPDRALSLPCVLLILVFHLFFSGIQGRDPVFRAVVLTETGGQHGPFTDAARVWLNKLASDSNFTIDYISNTDQINDDFLSQYQVFIQLDFPPYNWNEKAAAAFERYIIEGKGGGWVGFHHATLLGEFDGYSMWNWFSGFMGGIRFDNYIAGLAAGTVHTEDQSHPVMKGMPASFVIADEEWYTWDKSPRPCVHVLASVDESSYSPYSDITMGDHPVIWTNEKVRARNVYIFMGHHPGLFQNGAYTILVRNAIFWAAGE
jgi:uncharacterized protein